MLPLPVISAKQSFVKNVTEERTSRFWEEVEMYIVQKKFGTCERNARRTEEQRSAVMNLEFEVDDKPSMEDAYKGMVVNFDQPWFLISNHPEISNPTHI